MIRDEKQRPRTTHAIAPEEHRIDCCAQCAAHDNRGSWEDQQGEEIVAALRSYFLTHTLDPLTGEVHTVH